MSWVIALHLGGYGTDVFGPFEDEAEAGAACERLRANPPCTIDEDGDDWLEVTEVRAL